MTVGSLFSGIVHCFQRVRCEVFGHDVHPMDWREDCPRCGNSPW